jgi:hypothetical protein
MPPVAVMITMEGREDSAEATVNRLSAVGVETRVFWQPHDWPVGPESNNRNSRRAFEWAMGNCDEPGVIFVEDDIFIKPDRFLRAYDAAVKQDELMYFYMHDFSPRTLYYPDEAWIRVLAKSRSGDPIKVARKHSEIRVQEGPRRMKVESKMFGGQCVYIPMKYVSPIHSGMSMSTRYRGHFISSPTQPIDTSLNNWRRGNNKPAYCYLPHPVQHIQNRTRRVGSRKDVYSFSFDLESNLDTDRDKAVVGMPEV